MGVERVDYYSDEEYQSALQQEAQEYNQQEPEVVPCYLCEDSMYIENKEPKYNICQCCKNIINGVLPETNKSEVVEELPF